MFFPILFILSVAERSSDRLTPFIKKTMINISEDFSTPLRSGRKEKAMVLGLR